MGKRSKEAVLMRREEDERERGQESVERGQKKRDGD